MQIPIHLGERGSYILVRDRRQRCGDLLLVQGMNEHRRGFGVHGAPETRERIHPCSHGLLRQQMPDRKVLHVCVTGLRRVLVADRRE